MEAFASSSTDWTAIRAFYLETRSFKATAERFGVALGSIKSRAHREKWSEAMHTGGASPQPGMQTGMQNGSSEPDPVHTSMQNGVPDPVHLHTGMQAGMQNGAPEASHVHTGMQEMHTEAARVHTGMHENWSSDGSNGDTESPGGNTGADGPVPVIPATINSMSRLEAARFYHGTLGWAVHPLYAPNRGAEAERGKKPINSGWRSHTAANVDPDDLTRDFGEGSGHNLGTIVRPPFVHIDLDSKPDCGESVREWLSDQPGLSSVPRERTRGGVHLVFRSPDVPDAVLKLRKPLTFQITEKVSGEIYTNGMNIALSPSVHKSGHRYSWEVIGEIPKWSWARIADAFGLKAAEQKPRGRPPKEKPWWSRFQGDIATLDIVALMQELGAYGEIIDADERKHSVRCPWCKEHSDAGKNWNSRSSDTVIYEATHGRWPGFNCLHAHCAERSLEQVVAWADARAPGIINKHCRAERVWKSGQRSDDGVRQRLVLPGTGIPDSVFATQVGTVIGGKKAWFSFSDNIVVVRQAADVERLGPGFSLQTLRPIEAITEVESHLELGMLSRDEAGDAVFVSRSMSEANARVLMSAPMLRTQLPVIRRVLDVATPVIHDGVLTFPNIGYDPRFKTYLCPDAPELVWVTLDEAKEFILTEILGDRDNGGFCWKDEQSRVHALARLITPFCRGLMGWARAPLWIYEANRERCGKDYMAGLTLITFTGRSLIGAPPNKDAEEEVRKRITSALMAGARFIHFANIKGHVRYASLEAATDNSRVWQDRILGGNTEVSLPNEAEFSFSGNAGTTWEPDIEGRARRIALHYEKEEINNRRFRHTDLHHFVSVNRSRVLSCICALVTEWERQGRPDGKTPFASFPEWARVVGGIMDACGLGDPCLPHEDKSAITGDQNTEGMKKLFGLAADEFGDAFVKKKDVYELLEKNQEGILEWIDLGTRSGQTVLGKLLARFVNRELGGVRLSMPPSGKNNAQYQFLRLRDDAPEGTSGSSGTSASPYIGTKKSCNDEEKENVFTGSLYSDRADVPKDPQVPAIVDRAALDGIAEEVAVADAPVALDIETYRVNGGAALSPFDSDAEIRLLSLCLPGREPWVLDLRAIGYDLGPLHGVLETAEVVGHNLKFDLLWLHVKCGLKIPRAFCTMTASRLLTAGSKEPNDLGAVIQRHLRIKLPKDQGRSDWGGMLLTPQQIAYAASDVRHLHALRSKLDQEINDADLRQVCDLEMRLLPVVVEIEAAGFPVDADRLQSIGEAALERAGEVAGRIREVFRDEKLNVASPVQLKEAFERIGIKVEDTGVDSLSGIDHTAARLVLEYRGHEKLGQQTASLIEAISTDGRIHARFEPSGTETGRFSSRDPNLQNVRRGEVRNAFVAPPGEVLIVADYSQIELRGAAAIANDPLMLEAIRKGEDLHRKTAALVLAKPESEVTKEDRQTAKSVNFAISYGQSAGGLVNYARTSFGVTLTLEDAKRFRERFFVAYRGIAAWHKNAWRKAGEIGGLTRCEVRTRTGRRRLLPRGGDDWHRFTGLINNSVQGTCADGLKLAMVELAAQLPPQARMIATVHDELVLTAPQADAEAVRDLVVKVMRSSMEKLLPEVPVEVEAKICTRWGEK